MFNQRKSFWKSRWLYLAVAAVLITGYWVSQKEVFPHETDSVENGQEVPDTDVPAGIQNNTENKEGGKVSGESNYPREADYASFFLIKKVNETIDVYYYEGEGEPIFIKSADIEFSLLGDEDQKKFSYGIIAETEEELNEILQDFGS